MNLFVRIFFTFFTLTLWADTGMRIQVKDMDHGSIPQDEILVFLSNGKVAKIFSVETKILEGLEEARRTDQWLEITLNEKRHITRLRSAHAPSEFTLDYQHLKDLENYTPSVINSQEEALSIFKTARSNHKDSQCYNRAHVWAYEWRLKQKLFTSKMWLFFTRKYIRKYNFEWWFHISPYFLVEEEGRIWERIADVKYARGPIKLKQWTDIFLRNDADCPLVNNYSEWANYPETGWCYVMKTSMYYYRPLDMEVLEKDGVERNVWDPNEVQQAFKEAFDVEV